jgi:molecular chaperone GrpE (heat shock protein)
VTREEAGRKQANDHDQLRKLVIDLARAHHQLRVFLDRHTEALESAALTEQSSLLATIRDRYAQVLARAGVELIYLDGRPFTLDANDKVEVTAWIPAADIDRPRVRETVSPGVLLNGELVCPAEVEVATPAQPGVLKPPEVSDEPCDRD